MEEYAIKYFLLILWVVGYSIACSISYYVYYRFHQEDEDTDSVLTLSTFINIIILVVVAYSILNY